MQQDWKNALLGTLSDAERETIARKREAELSAVPKCGVQHFTVELDKRQKGKVATLVTGYMGSEDDLKELASLLKKKCGAGGSVRDGEILVQGDCRTKVADALVAAGHKVKVK